MGSICYTKDASIDTTQLITDEKSSIANGYDSINPISSTTIEAKPNNNSSSNNDITKPTVSYKYKLERKLKKIYNKSLTVVMRYIQESRNILWNDTGIYKDIPMEIVYMIVLYHGGCGIPANILVIGDADTEKTDFINRYFHKTIDPDISAFLGINFLSKKVHVDDEYYNVQLWEISDQNKFIGLECTPNYYKNAVGALIFCSVINAKSLVNARKWILDVNDKLLLRNGEVVPVILITTKWDQIESNPAYREIADEELDKFCHENNVLGWFSVNTKSGMNVKKSVNFMICKIRRNDVNFKNDENRKKIVTKD